MFINRRWVTSCVTSFLIQFAVFGLHNNFGIIFYELTLIYHETPAVTAWIGSLAMGATFVISPFSNLLMSCIGHRLLLIISFLCCVVSFVSTSFVNNLYVITFTYSILYGFGAGVANHASLVALQVHAKEKISLANGISSSGSGVGTLALGPCLTYFIKKYGFRWSFRACVLLPVLFIPSIIFTGDFKSSDDNESDKSDKKCLTLSSSSVKSAFVDQNCNLSSKQSDIVSEANHSKNNKQKKKVLSELLDREIWKHIPYVVFIFGFSTFLFGYFIPFVFLVQHAVTFDISINKAQFLIGMLSIVSTVVKVFGGLFIDMQSKINRSTLFLVALFTMSLSQLVAAFATQYYHFVIFSIIFGVCEGLVVGQVPAVVLDVIPRKEKIGVALANLFAVMSLPIMVGPVVAGNLSSSSKSFSTPFIVASAVSFLGAVITSTVKLFKKKTTVVDAYDEHLISTNKETGTSLDPSVTFTTFTQSSNFKLKQYVPDYTIVR